MIKLENNNSATDLTRVLSNATRYLVVEAIIRYPKDVDNISKSQFVKDFILLFNNSSFENIEDNLLQMTYIYCKFIQKYSKEKLHNLTGK